MPISSVKPRPSSSENPLPPNAASRQVIDNYRRSASELVDPMIPRWRVFYETYRSYVEEQENGFMTQLFLPLIFSHTEAYLPRLAGARPQVEVWPRTPEDRRRAMIHRMRILYLWDALQMVWRLIPFVKSGEVYGAAWIKSFYRKEQRDRLIREPVFGAVNLELPFGGVSLPGDLMPSAAPVSFRDIVKPVTVWDEVDVDYPPLDDVFPDPDGSSPDDCAWIVQYHEAISIDELEARKDIDGKPYFKPSVIAEIKKRARQSNPRQMKRGNSLRESQLDMSGRGDPVKDEWKLEVTCLEQWSDGHETWVVLEYEDLPPLRHERNRIGVKPFDLFTPIPLPNEIYGMSFPEVLYSINIEANTLNAGMIDNMLRSVYTLVSYLNTSNINPNHLMQRMGGHVMLNDHDEIKFWDQPSFPFSLHREMDELRGWSQMALATDTFMGLNEGQGGGTATEASLLAQASGTRAGLMFTILSHQLLGPMAKNWIRLGEAHISEEQILRITGGDSAEEFFSFKPEEMLMGSGLDLDLMLDVGTEEPALRTLRMDKAMAGLQSLMPMFVDPATGQPNREDPLFKFLMRRYVEGLGAEDPDALLDASPQDLALGQQQAAQLPGGSQDLGSLAAQLTSLTGGQ